MPKYFFHVRSSGEIIRDTEGLNLPNSDCVSEARLRSVTKAVAEEEPHDGETEEFEFQVESESGETVLVFPFRI